MFEATKLKKVEFKRKKSYSELLAENEQLLLDNRLLAEDLQYTRYVLTYPPKYIKGNIVAERYLILEFKPYKEHFINGKLENLIFGGAIVLGIDLLFGRKYHATKAYLKHLERLVETKPAWKYRVYDKKLNQEREMFESEMRFAELI